MGGTQKTIQVRSQHGSEYEQVVVNVYASEVSVRQQCADDVYGSREEYMLLDRALFDQIVEAYLAHKAEK